MVQIQEVCLPSTTRKGLEFHAVELCVQVANVAGRAAFFGYEQLVAAATRVIGRDVAPRLCRGS